MVNGHLEISIHLVIQFQECLLGFIIKTIHAHLDCLCLVLEDAVSTDDVNQSAGADDFLNTTIVEGLADDVSPVTKTLTEVTVFHTKVQSNTLKDFLLGLRSRILLLEGKGVFLKKIGKYVRPAAGFNVVATANTKGKGSDDGRFIGTNVLNEAFLERFPVTFEQEYPTTAIEQKILNKISSDEDFNKRLCDWADIIRKTFYDGGIDEIISTRRLVHIVRAYGIFGDKAKAIQTCINRFDADTKQAFQELYDKVDADVEFVDGVQTAPF